MVEKRKMPARGKALEAASRKRTATPPPPEPEIEEVKEPVQDPLPLSIKDGQPLPTVLEAQGELSFRQFQSIAER
jgi:hypothetical protein